MSWLHIWDLWKTRWQWLWKWICTTKIKNACGTGKLVFVISCLNTWLRVLWMEVCWLICVVLVAWRMMTGGSPYMWCWFASCWWLGGWWLVARVPANWKISFYWAWLTKWRIFYAEGHLLIFENWLTSWKPKVLPRWSACRTGLCMNPWKPPDISLCIWIQPLVGGAICWNKRCFELFGGLLTCLMPCVYPTDMFDREYPDMFWHVWACTVAVAITLDLASGGLLTCLISVSLICLAGRILTCFGMFEHAPLLLQELLILLQEVYWHVWFLFLWYVCQVVSWHVLTCLNMRRCCRNNFWPWLFARCSSAEWAARDDLYEMAKKNCVAATLTWQPSPNMSWWGSLEVK